MSEARDWPSMPLIATSAEPPFRNRLVAVFSRAPGDWLVLITVARIGGRLPVQPYTIVQKDGRALKHVAPRMDAYLFHLLNVKVRVEWRMSQDSGDEQSYLFTGEIGVSYPNKLLAITSRLEAGSYFIGRHLHEEVSEFALRIQRNFKLEV